MDKLNSGILLLCNDYLSSQNLSDCDSFQRIFDIIVREISKLFPNCLITEDYIFLQVTHAGCSQKIYTYEELCDGKCILPSQFLSDNNIEYFSDQVRKHFSTMSRALFISRVFKCYSSPLTSFKDENSSSISPPKSLESQPMSVLLDTNATFIDSKDTSSTSANNDIHIQSDTYDFQVDSLTAEISHSTPYSIDSNIANPNNLDVNKNPLSDSKCIYENRIDPLESEILSFQNPVSPLYCDHSTQSNCNKVLSKDKFQLLIQNWMQIRICKFSNFFCSIYNDALKHNFDNHTYSVEYSTQIGKHLKSNSFVKKVAFGNLTNSLIDLIDYSSFIAREEANSKGYMTITSRMHGMVLDVSGGKKENGTKVHAWPSNKTEAQQWHFTEDCRIESALKDGMFLDIRESKNSKGTTCCISEKNCSDSQRWQFTDDGNIVSILNNNVLDIRGSNKNKGTEIILWPNWGGENQRWDLDECDR